MTAGQLRLADEYEQFVEKFKPKKTTDDCYTPLEIYEVIAEWVADRYGLDPATFVRPFWPGGDYERHDYPDGCVVVDNPPFSMLSRIIDHYMTRGVRFFLFAPTFTCISAKRHLMDTNHIICDAKITYENGAKVNTSFITNLDEDGTVLESAPDLSDAINAKDDELCKAKTKKLPKYEYPIHVITAAKANWFCAHHTPYKLNRRDCAPIAKIDAMGGKSIFGGAFLLSERAAAERAAAERAAAIRYELSDRERAMVELLGRSAGDE